MTSQASEGSSDMSLTCLMWLSVGIVVMLSVSVLLWGGKNE